MKSYQAYLFDADGTLFDTTEMIYLCFEYTCKKYANLQVKRGQVFSNIGIPLRKQLEIFLGPQSDEKASEIQKTHMEFQLSIYKKHLRLFPGVANVLSQLKNAGKKLAIVTSRRKKTLTLYLKHTNIFNFFNVFITPESTEKHKPDAEPALEALKQLHCKATETLFIGDAIFDIKSGEKAGIDTALILWSKKDISSFKTKPTYILKNLNTLVKPN